MSGAGDIASLAGSRIRLDPTVVRNYHMLHLFTRLLPQLVGAERCGIFIHNPHSRTLWTKSGTGIEEREIEVPCEGSIAGRAILTNQAIIADGLEASAGPHKRTDAATHFITHNLLCVPIPTPGGGTPIGAIEVLNKQNGSFTAEDQDLLTEVASYISVGIEQFYFSQDVTTLASHLRDRSRWAQRLAIVTMVLWVAIIGVLVVMR